MTSDELMALEHENWIAYLTGVVTCAGRADVTCVDGVVTVMTGVPFDWYNQVLIQREDATAVAVLAGIRRARALGIPFVARLREGIDDRHISTLIDAGMKAAGAGTSIPGMAWYPVDDRVIRGQVAPQLEILRATDARDVDIHRQVVTAGFGIDPVVARASACPDLFGRPEVVVYVGHVNGEPVVSGLGWRTGRTIGVYSIATVESARRHGYGAAMTARVVADGVEAGCDVAVLQASEMGRPIYERLGFRTAVTYAAYVDPGGPDCSPDRR